MLKPSQSLSISSDLISAVFANFLYTRGVFEEDIFADTLFGKSHGLKAKELIAGVSQDADNLIAWINGTAHPALAQGYLEDIQITLVDKKGGASEGVRIRFQFPFDTVHVENSPPDVDREDVWHQFVLLLQELTSAEPIAADFAPGSLLISHRVSAMGAPHSAPVDREVHQPETVIGTMHTGYCLVHVTRTSSVTPLHSPDCECGAQLSELHGAYFKKMHSTLKCRVCQRTVHRACYGTSGKDKLKQIECYSCIFGGEISLRLLTVMRIRFLWRYYNDFDLPTSTAFYGAVYPHETESNLVFMLNTMFKYCILEYLTRVLYQNEKLKILKPKTLIIEITFPGLRACSTSLEVGDEVFFMYSPLLIYRKVTGLHYLTKSKDLFFSHKTATRRDELEAVCDTIFAPE